MIWSAISSILFQCLRQLRCIATFISPITFEKHQTSGFAFVDDTDLVASEPTKLHSDYDITPAMQKSLDTWQGCLTTTGGALDWDDRKKCYCYTLQYSHNQQGRIVYSNDETDTQLSMLDDNNQRQMVYQCKPDEARKTLGVFIAPDGNMDAQIEYMYNKVCSFSSKIETLPAY